MAVDSAVSTTQTVPGRGREELAVVVGAVLLLGFALWRTTLGVDLSDDAHVVALALRLAGGDLPLVDEMNLQALGSLPAVPFTWAWKTLFGTSGIVLASRIFYVCVSALAAWVAYRALRTGFRPAIAAASAVAPLLAPAYNLPVLSYNTVPLLSLVVGSAAGFAAVRTGRAAWGAVSAGVVVLGAVFYPPMAVGGTILLVLLLALARSKRVALGVLLAGTAVAVPAGLWYLLVIGPDAVRTTLDYTNGFLAERLTTRERFARSWEFYRDNVWRRRYWPAWGLAVLATLPRLPHWLRSAFVALVPVAVVAGSLLSFPEDTPAPFGRVVAVNAIVVGAVLLVPVCAFVVSQSRRDLGQLLVLTIPGSVAQAVVILLTTSSGPAWGIPYIGLAPLFVAIVVGWLSIVERGRRGASVLAGGTLVVAFGLLLTLKPFKDPYPWDLGARIAHGPFAGLATTSTTSAGLAETARALDATVRPDQTLLVYGYPGAYLLTEAKPVTPTLWLVNTRRANQYAVDHLTARGERPDVVLVHVNQVSAAGGWEQLRQQDPLIDWLSEGYDLRDGPSGPFRVLTAAPTGR